MKKNNLNYFNSVILSDHLEVLFIFKILFYFFFTVEQLKFTKIDSEEKMTCTVFALPGFYFVKCDFYKSLSNLSFV